MADRFSLEQQLFTWDGCDDNGTLCPMFYGVSLLVPIGEFPAGTKFDVAFFEGDVSILRLCTEDEKEYAFELRLSVGDKIMEIQSEKPKTGSI